MSYQCKDLFKYLGPSWYADVDDIGVLECIHLKEAGYRIGFRALEYKLSFEGNMTAMVYMSMN